MKKILTLILLVVAATMAARSQDYDIRMAGQGESGKYYVQVTAVLDKNQNKTALEWLQRLAADGVMFRGVASAKGVASQSALIQDHTAKARKSEWFDAFYRDGLYKNYVNLESESVVVTKLPKKKFEVSGRLVVDKEQLIKLLQDAGIIQGFNNLW